MPNIHSTAIIHSTAVIQEGVEIGPYCVIGPNVKIGKGTRLHHHVSVFRRTTIGEKNIIYPFTSIGGDPQDLKYEGGDTDLLIGDANVIREYVTINRGTEHGGGLTSIGNSNLLMSYSHVAHDCILEDNIVISNSVQLAGHVKIERGVIIAGMAGVHHFATVGQYSYIGGLTPLRRDAPPFTIVSGDPPVVRSVNAVGMSRNGFSKEEVEAVKSAFYQLFKTDTPMAKTIEELEAKGNLVEPVVILLNALKESTSDLGRHGRAREALRAE